MINKDEKNIESNVSPFIGMVGCYLLLPKGRSDEGERREGLWVRPTLSLFLFNI